jgi:hypothetical protein
VFEDEASVQEDSEMKAHQKSILDSAQASQMRRHDRHNNRNSSMVQNYKVRVADFLK